MDHAAGVSLRRHGSLCLQPGENTVARVGTCALTAIFLFYQECYERRSAQKDVDMDTMGIGTGVLVFLPDCFFQKCAYMMPAFAELKHSPIGL